MAEVFNFMVDLGDLVFSDRDVVDDDLPHLDLFLEAGVGGQAGADYLLKCIPGLE